MGFVLFLLLFRLTIDGGEGHLCGVEEFAPGRIKDCVNEHAVGGAGDEVADVLVAGKRGHGLAVGFIGVDVCIWQDLAIDCLRFQGASPGIGAAGNGRVLKSRLGRVGDGWGYWLRYGLRHDGFFLPGIFGVDGSIVRRGRVILCKSREQGSGIRELAGMADETLGLAGSCLVGGVGLAVRAG